MVLAPLRRLARGATALVLALQGVAPLPARAAPVFARIGALSLTGNNNVVAAAVDANGTYAFFINDAGVVSRVALSGFSLNGSVTVPGVTAVGAAATDAVTGYLYFTAKVSGVVKLVRVNMSTLAHAPATDQLTLRSDAIGVPTAFDVDAAAHLGYVACAKSSVSFPAEMIRINLSSFTISLRKNATFPDDLNTVVGALNGSYFYGPSTTIYLSGRFAIGRILTSSLTLDGPNTQPSGTPAKVALMDGAAGQAFFMNTVGAITRVLTGAFPSAATLALTGSPVPGSGVIDRQNRYLVVGTTASPGVLRRVNLATFAESGSLTLQSGENNLSCAVYDSVAGYAYFGTRTSPSLVVKVQLNDFTATPPVNLALPTISGSAVQGQTLSGTLGSWGGSPTGYARQWRRCNSAGASCVDIGGATGSTYALGAGDIGSTLRHRITATNPSGSTAADSAATAVVQASAVGVSSVALSPSTVEGGAGTTGTVTLAAAAPGGGNTVALSSGDTAVVGVPASVTVPAGQTTASFSVETFPVLAESSIVISATSAGVTRTATLTVTVEADTEPPKVFPNPFRPASAAAITVRDLPILVDVKVVAADGRFVRALTADATGATTWDGLTEEGEPAPSGIYVILASGRAPVKIALQR